ncbi:MAG TPA: carboxypeptidase regulatory-like domain-containing protein, partial [Candidatus Eremiobacteraceae bacterium]|nr:carboxypeptidase regulatory-like domain-containing protein [Candidatus Eremiobacteraceae bacterium]
MLSRRSLQWVLGLFALLVLAPFQAFAGTTGVISGTTKDDHGVPVAAVRVSVTSPSQAASTLSTSSGFFSFLNLSPDTYRVTAVKDGYAPANFAGITVLADQTARIDITMAPTIRTLGRVTTTAAASLVSKSVTGDLYTVSAQSMAKYQGSVGGAETLYSQNGIVGSLPGVTRTVGTGGGYAGNGSLFFRGGSNDQVGFELEGIPLNRAFDSANATAFLTNGLSSLEVYTGGEPADAGRSMSGYINEIIHRGSFPGGADVSFVIGTPLLTNAAQVDVYGGTPSRHFTYYVSTLWVNGAYNFGDRSNLDNSTISIPANDVGCPAVAFNTSGNITCPNAQTKFNIPISQGAWSSFVNPSARMTNTVFNLNWTLDHNGLSDNLQALYMVGATVNPFNYSGPFVDPTTIANCGFETVLSNPCPTAPAPMVWPFGMLYKGQVGQPFNPSSNNLYTLTWPSANGSTSDMPPNYLDSQRTQSAIEKIGYTRALTNSSFLRLYAYSIYSLWNFDQATNG